MLHVTCFEMARPTVMSRLPAKPRRFDTVKPAAARFRRTQPAAV